MCFLKNVSEKLNAKPTVSFKIELELHIYSLKSMKTHTNKSKVANLFVHNKTCVLEFSVS